MSAVEQAINGLDKLNTVRRVKRMQKAVEAIIYRNNLDMPIKLGMHRCAFVTLTYRPGVEWEALHITQLLKCYEGWAKRRKIELSIVWVMELHKSGIPHYHALIWLPKGFTPPMPDKQGWWKHGSTNATWLRRPSNYIAKYFSKSESKTGNHVFPKGARIFGHRGLSDGAMAEKHYWSLPFWLQKITEVGERCIRLFGGWWYNTVTDYSFRSPWVLHNDQEAGWVFKNVGFTTDDILPFDVREWLEEYVVDGQKRQRFSPELSRIMCRARG